MRTRTLVVFGGLIIALVTHLFLSRSSSAIRGSQETSHLPTENAPAVVALEPASSQLAHLKRHLVAGRVTSDGAPLENVAVRLEPLMNLGSKGVLTQRTDATGHFRFSEIPGAEYSVSANAEGYVASVRTIDLRQANSHAEEIELVLSACKARIVGHVLDSGGGRIASARVRLKGAEGVTSGVDGSFELCVPIGQIEVAADAAGYGAAWLNIASAEGSTEHDIILMPEARLHGRVLLGDSSEPAAFARVLVFTQRRSDENMAPLRTTSDAQGHFELALAPGQFLLTAEGVDGHSTVTAVAATTTFGVDSDDVILRLKTALSRVVGSVSKHGQPLAATRVTALSKLTATRAVAVTDENGRFALESVSPGPTIFLVAEHETITPTEKHIRANEESVAIEVKDLGSLHGVISRSRQPVTSATISVRASGIEKSVVSGPLGQYSVRGLPAGDYEILAQHDEIGAFDKKYVVLANAEDRLLDIDLVHGATISGVVEANHLPLSGVRVQFKHLKTGDVGVCVTDTNGHFTCGEMTGHGEYEAAVFAPSGEELPPDTKLRTRLSLTDGNAHVRGVVLSVSRNRGYVNGRVVDSSGVGVADVSIRLSSTGPAISVEQSNLRTVSDTRGSFTFEVMSDGPWRLFARAPDGAEASVPELHANTRDVVLALPALGDLEGTLVGYQTPAVVYAANVRGEFTFAPRDAATFRLRLAPGTYVVTAMSAAEGDTQRVEVKPGAVTRTVLTSHGSASVRGRVLDHLSQTPIAGVLCRAVMRNGDDYGITNWSYEASPRTDGRGEFTLESVPAGDIFVQCLGGFRKVSDASLALHLSPGEHANVTLEAVNRSQGPIGDVGLSFRFSNEGPRVRTVDEGSSAAAAGIQVGELITAIDGYPTGSLDPGAAFSLIANHPIGSFVALTTQLGDQSKTRSLLVVPL